jgi:hypothetical protein
LISANRQEWWQQLPVVEPDEHCRKWNPVTDGGGGRLADDLPAFQGHTILWLRSRKPLARPDTPMTPEASAGVHSRIAYAPVSGHQNAPLPRPNTEEQVIA